MTEELKELLGEDGSRIYEKAAMRGRRAPRASAQRSSPVTPRHGQSAYRVRQGSLSRHRIT